MSAAVTNVDGRGLRRPIVLVVDDNVQNLELIDAYLESVPCDVVLADSGERALDRFRECRPDVVLLDVNLPDVDGFEVCRRLKSTPGGRLVPVVMITALNGTADRVVALEAGADDFMTKPVDGSELVARTRASLRTKAALDHVESAEQVIFALAAAVEAKDAYTEAHTQRVASAAVRLGTQVGLDERCLDALAKGGAIHDIGKIGIPDGILQKPGPLDPSEHALMRQHPSIGESIALPLNASADLIPIIRHHHENYDGSGYPDGLAGQRIPLTARIVAVCDAFDAITSDRPYRPARSIDEAVGLLRAGRGSQWDPVLVDLFVAGLEDRGSSTVIQ